MPIIRAFCLSAAGVRLKSLASFATAVFVLEWVRSSFSSALVQALRLRFKGFLESFCFIFFAIVFPFVDFLRVTKYH